MTTKLTEFLAVGQNYWGKGLTSTEAINQFKQAGGSQKDYDLFICHPDTFVNDMGDFSYARGSKPGENAPLKIKKIRKGKEQPST